MAFVRGFKREKGKKYNNTKVEYDSIKFDSKRERDRYIILKQAKEDGKIENLVVHPKFDLVPAVKEKVVKHLKTKDKEIEKTVQLAITYTADFSYYKDSLLVVEDVKASPNFAALDKAFIIKEKLFRWKYGFPIKRVYKPNEEI